jgi:hypothetical protein
MKSSGMVGRTLQLAPLLLIMGAAPPEPVSTWHVQRVSEAGAVKCRIESEKAAVNDGYQNITVQVIVSANNIIQIVSDSIYDGGSGDIGIQVDKNPFVKLDKLGGERSAVFEASAATLIPQFKAGLRARLQLRFWPTWPVTGTHDAEVSLIGFTKAYEEMVGNCH